MIIYRVEQNYSVSVLGKHEKIEDGCELLLEWIRDFINGNYGTMSCIISYSRLLEMQSHNTLKI